LAYEFVSGCFDVSFITMNFGETLIILNAITLCPLYCWGSRRHTLWARSNLRGDRTSSPCCIGRRASSSLASLAGSIRTCKLQMKFCHSVKARHWLLVYALMPVKNY